MSRYTKHLLPSGYIDICFDGKPLLSIHPEAGAPNERLAEWLRECLSTGLGSCTLELAAPAMLAALHAGRRWSDAYAYSLERGGNLSDAKMVMADVVAMDSAIALATGKEG